MGSGWSRPPMTGRLRSGRTVACFRGRSGEEEEEEEEEKKQAAMNVRRKGGVVSSFSLFSFAFGLMGRIR